MLLPVALARNLSSISQLVVAKGVNSGLQVVDPYTGEVRTLEGIALSSLLHIHLRLNYSRNNKSIPKNTSVIAFFPL